MIIINKQINNKGSQAIYDPTGLSWCGSGCGVCYRLTPTGGYVNGQGSAPSSTTSYVFMVTNLCPNNGNEQVGTSPFFIYYFV